MNKAGVSWKYVVPLLKMEQTSIGLGAVFNLVRDQDGQISKSIDFYLKQNIPALNKYIVDELEMLKQHLLAENIVFRDLNSDNILYYSA